MEEFKNIEETKDNSSYTDDNATIQKHPSFGMISFNRTSSSEPRNLFGSSIQHKQTIIMRVYKAELLRNLNSDRYHADNTPLVEVELSQTQFAEAITSFNQGNGVPCTITYAEKQRTPKISGYENKKDRFTKELKDNLQKILSLIKNKRVVDLLEKKSTLTVSERKEIKDVYLKIIQEIEANLPFAQSCFTEAMNRTVLEAKGEVEAFVQNKITTLGLKALKDIVNNPLLEE